MLQYLFDFRTIPIIFLIFVQSDIFSSNQVSTKFEQVLVEFTFISYLISVSNSSNPGKRLFSKPKEFSSCHNSDHVQFLKLG